MALAHDLAVDHGRCGAAAAEREVGVADEDAGDVGKSDHGSHDAGVSVC